MKGYILTIYQKLKSSASQTLTSKQTKENRGMMYDNVLSFTLEIWTKELICVLLTVDW